MCFVACVYSTVHTVNRRMDEWVETSQLNFATLDTELVGKDDRADDKSGCDVMRRAWVFACTSTGATVATKSARCPRTRATAATARATATLTPTSCASTKNLPR